MITVKQLDIIKPEPQLLVRIYGLLLFLIMKFVNTTLRQPHLTFKRPRSNYRLHIRQENNYPWVTTWNRSDALSAPRRFITVRLTSQMAHTVYSRRGDGSFTAALLNGKSSRLVRNSIRQVRWRSDAGDDQRCAVSLTSGSEKKTTTRRSSDRWLHKTSLSYETPCVCVCVSASLSLSVSLRCVVKKLLLSHDPPSVLRGVGHWAGAGRGGPVRARCVRAPTCVWVRAAAVRY